ALVVWENVRDRTTPTAEPTPTPAAESTPPGRSDTHEPLVSPVPEPAKALTAEQKRGLEKTEAQHKRERETEEKQARISAAKFFEDKLLAAGYSADVFTSGPRNTYLTLRYIQFTKAFQYQFNQQEQDTLRSWREVGFTKVTMTDG